MVNEENQVKRLILQTFQFVIDFLLHNSGYSMAKDEKEISKRIANDLEIQIDENLSDEEMILHIADRVEQLLKSDPDLMLSYLYRLDVEEKRISQAMETSIMPIHVTFANLIWERQKQRLMTKKKYKQDPIKGWEL